MADAVGAAFMDRVANRSGAVSLSGMAGARHVVPPSVGKGSRVARRRVARLAAGEIEPDDAFLLVGDRELRQLHRLRWAVVAKRADDHSPHDSEIGRANV